MIIDDYSQINSKQLDFIKDNLCDLFELPYKSTKDIYFKKSQFKGTILVCSKSTYIGTIDADNGLHSQGKYYLILSFHSTFHSRGGGTEISGIVNTRNNKPELVTLEEISDNIYDFIQRFKSKF